MKFRHRHDEGRFLMAIILIFLCTCFGKNLKKTTFECCTWEVVKVFAEHRCREVCVRIHISLMFLRLNVRFGVFCYLNLV